jgi:hypothetical protein
MIHWKGMTMTDRPKPLTWLRSIEIAAKEQSIELPSFARQPMGVGRSEEMPNGRFVTVKHRLVPKAIAAKDGIEWTLWQKGDEYPVAAVAFRLPSKPEWEAVNFTLNVLKGWLLDNMTVEEVRAVIHQSVRNQSLESTPNCADSGAGG